MNKDLSLLCLSRLISILGDQFYAIALNVTLYTITNSALISTAFLAIRGLINLLGFSFLQRTKEKKNQMFLIKS